MRSAPMRFVILKFKMRSTAKRFVISKTKKVYKKDVWLIYEKEAQRLNKICLDFQKRFTEEQLQAMRDQLKILYYTDAADVDFQEIFSDEED